MICLTFLVRRRPDVDDAEFHRYWRDEHGPLVASHARALGIRGYRQLHRLDSPLGTFVNDSRGAERSNWDGAALVWFDSEEALATAAGSAEGLAAGAALLEDEGRFLDLPRCQLFLNDDVTVVPFGG